MQQLHIKPVSDSVDINPLLWVYYADRNYIEKAIQFHLRVSFHSGTGSWIVRQGQAGGPQGHAQEIRNQDHRYCCPHVDVTPDLKESELLIIEREIKIHSTMDHPHIVKLWDTLQDNSTIYMVMEYASNGSLFKYHSKQLAQGNHPPLGQVYQFFYQTLQAVSYLHNQDLMHRDIKVNIIKI